MHPHALPLALKDDLLEATPLADEVEQLPQSLGTFCWHDVSGLTCEVLAVLYASDGLINVPASEARGHLDRFSELLSDAVEVVHQSQEVSLLSGVGGIGDAETDSRTALRHLGEGKVLAHSRIS